MSWQLRFEKIIANKAFEFFIIFIIMASALTVGAKTFNITPFWLSVLEVADIAITVIFVVEISARFLATNPRWDFFKNGWNIFDTLIVTISLIPIENSDVALVARLIRVFRVLRMISIIPELRILLNSLLKALPRLGYVMALMFIIFYIYAAVGTTFFSSINSVLWGDISISMLTLFRVMTFEDWTDVMYEVMTIYGYAWVYFLSFIFLTTFAFLNMVIGIVVNVMENENAAERLADGEPSMSDLRNELADIKALLKHQGS
jgi:voltage-gated sodium channel